MDTKIRIGIRPIIDGRKAERSKATPHKCHNPQYTLGAE